MTQPIEVAENIYAIETGLYRHGLASCYLVREADRLAFVDTGTAHTTPHLLQFIADLGLTPDHVDWVIPTHVHLDHAGGAGDLMAACPQARLVIHPRGRPTCSILPS
jgi:glyoxylase-like metal-dependent hydrolase (beta-lactamase superfamily II)